MKTVLHFTPAKGWLNDPNGLIEHHGIHHLFFQHNPRDVTMRDMCWGHASSTDLLSWTEHPVALSPGSDGSYDRDGCWSGCAVRDAGGIAIMYSGNKDGIQLPCLARSLHDDLIVWEKSRRNPVVRSRPPIEGITDMRDHSVRWDGDQWRHVLAGGAAGEGMLYGYSSPELTRWSWDGIVLRAGDADLPGIVWECPDVFANGTEVVAIISVIPAAGDNRRPVIWVTGSLHGVRIVPERWGLVDYGNRLYVPQSYTDATGRRIMFGWLTTQLDEAALGQPSLGVASLPRVLSVSDGRLHQEPATELHHRRGKAKKLTIHSGDASLSASFAPASALEIRLECPAGAVLLGSSIEFTDDAAHSFTVDLGMFETRGQLPRPDEPASRDGDPGYATVIFDSGIVEVFLGDGRAAAVSDVRLNHASAVTIRRTGHAEVEVRLWPLTAARNDRP